MRGVTAEEYAHLCHLAVSRPPAEATYEQFVLNETMVAQRRVDEYEGVDVDGDEAVFWKIGALGLLAIKLWPAVRQA